jgi:hypothetical protein
MPKGTKENFKAQGSYSDGASRDITDIVVWSSSADTVAAVSNASGQKGQVTALAVGSAEVIAEREGVKSYSRKNWYWRGQVS